jgi:hypothetical protein
MLGRKWREPKWRTLKSKIIRRQSFNTIPELTRAEDPWNSNRVQTLQY